MATWEQVRDGAQAPTEEIVAEGLEASKAFIKQLCEAQAELADVAAKPVTEFPRFLDYQDDVVRRRRGRRAPVTSLRR